MLLCPPITQTSPIRMLSSVMVASFPLIAICNGSAVAGIAGKMTFHDRSAPAFVVCVCPPNNTVTASPDSAQPQMVIGFSR